MPTRVYPAIVFREREPGDENAFFALLPDLPGCITAANSLEALFDAVVEAAGLCLDGTARRDLPVATPLEQVDVVSAAGEEVLAEADLLAVWPVPVPVPGKSVRIRITLDEGLLERIDQAAVDFSDGRSGMLAEGARRLLCSKDEDPTT